MFLVRPLWKHYFANTSAVIFVIDSNDKDRLNQVQEELNHVFKEDELKDCLVLILANKQDIEGAMTVEQVTNALDLDQFKGRKWKIFGTCAVKGDGLVEAFNWLTLNLNSNANELTEPITETLNNLSALNNWSFNYFQGFKSKSI